jgi:transcriptional repressor NF-X1
VTAAAPIAASSSRSATRVCRYESSATGCIKPGCPFVHNNPRPSVAAAAAANGSELNMPDLSHRGRGRGSRRSQPRGQARSTTTSTPVVLLQRGDASSAPEPSKQPKVTTKQRNRRSKEVQPGKANPEADKSSLTPIAKAPTLDVANGTPAQHDLSASITAELDKERYECMICLDRILRRASTWHCTECHRVLHLECARRWGKTSSAQGESSQWQCPGCRAEVNSLPKTYFCFCGQTKQPQDDGYTHAHSCGEVCSGKRPGCKHPCSEPCHAGKTLLLRNTSHTLLYNALLRNA